MVVMTRIGFDFNGNDDIRKGPWNSEEDEVLLNHVKKNGPRDWSSIRSKGLLKRTGKSCRLRWVNKLRPGLRIGVKFSAEEERKVIDLQAQLGNKWARIATYLPGRTDNDVKNFWSNRRKRLERSLQKNPKPSNKNPSQSGNIINHAPALQAPKIISSSTQEESVKSEPTKVLKLSELFYPSSLQYNQLGYNFEEKPLFNSLLPDFSLPLEEQDLFPKLGDPSFMGLFGGNSFSELEKMQFPGNNHLGNNVAQPDICVDDFPPIDDVFRSLELFPSPSKYGRELN